MKNIGIIGAGIAGLQLGLLLQKRGVAATIYAEKSPDQLRASRLANIVIRHAPTRERERYLGVDHWEAPETQLANFGLAISGQPIGFVGDMGEPAQIVDMRLYCARLLEDFCERGGQLVLGMVQAGDLERLALQHDLLVVATGRASFGGLFPRIPERSPFDKPQRVVVGGLYHGMAYPQPLRFDVVVVPGQGEIIILPIVSSKPNLTGIGIEIVAGGAFEPLKQIDYAREPERFDQTVLGLLRDYAPSIYARIDLSAFRLSESLDLCHVAITPAVRQGYAKLASGKFAIALGDAHILIDPLTGQGANNASHAAWVLGEAICSSATFGAAFCQQVEQQICSYVGPVADACAARLGPPQPHVLQLLAAATHSQPIADAYARGFHSPARFWEIVSSPRRTAELLEQYGWAAQPNRLADAAAAESRVVPA